MKLQDQVCSLELAKKLKELGKKQESYFYWVYRPARKRKGAYKGGKESWEVERYLLEWLESSKKMDILKDDKDTIEWMNKFEFISAYTVAELGEMLPGRIKYEGADYNLFTSKFSSSTWTVWYRKTLYSGGTVDRFMINDTQVNAMAKMVIYLKDNKLI